MRKIFGPKKEEVPIYCDTTHEFHFVVDIYTILLVYEPLGPPVWSSGQSSGYRYRGPGFDPRRYQIF